MKIETLTVVIKADVRQLRRELIRARLECRKLRREMKALGILPADKAKG